MKLHRSLTILCAAAMMTVGQAAVAQFRADKFLDRVEQAQGSWSQNIQNVVPQGRNHFKMPPRIVEPPVNPPVNPPTCPGKPRPIGPPVTFPVMPVMPSPAPPVFPPPVVTPPIVTPPVFPPPVVTPPIVMPPVTIPPIVTPPVVTPPVVTPPTPDTGNVKVQRLLFVVRTPARMPQAQGEPIPHSNPVHLGVSVNDSVFAPVFGEAVVSGGSKVGDKWLGCTYTAGPYSIPGFGDVVPAP